MSTSTYRWNARQAAEDYDAAGPQIHPLYDEVHEAVIEALPNSTAHVADLGGGSGRLAERMLADRPRLTATVVDPSTPFLQLAAERLDQHADRVRLVCSRAQEPDWPARVGRCDAIVSTSALHHLDPGEKNAVFAACQRTLPTGGLFINGDEYRPPSDRAYFDHLEEWRDHMRSALAAGLIPETFGPHLDRWEQRNLADFGGPRTSGDDCHETVEEQIARLYGAGFGRVEVTFQDRLWAVLVAHK